VSWFDVFGLAPIKQCVAILGVHMILLYKRLTHEGELGQYGTNSEVRRRFVVNALVKLCPTLVKYKENE
jgi:hypothetical protein